MALAALVDRRGESVVRPADVAWWSSLDGDLGRGLQIVVDLSEGRHELVASAPDGAGGTMSQRAIIVIGG